MDVDERELEMVPFTPGMFLDSEEAITEYLRLVLADGDAEEIAESLEVAAEARAKLRRKAAPLRRAVSLDEAKGFGAVVDAVRSLGFGFNLTPLAATA